MRRAIAAVALVLAGCGGGWAAQDTKAITDAIHAQQALTRFCVGDAGCNGDQVLAVDESVECNLGSILARHGADSVVDAGACRP